MTKKQTESGMGFTYLRDNNEGDGSIFQLRTQLPDDGVPGSDSFLVVTVVTHYEEATEVTIDVESHGKSHRVGGFFTENIQIVGRMLYGTATVVTTHRIQPLV